MGLIRAGGKEWREGGGSGGGGGGGCESELTGFPGWGETCLASPYALWASPAAVLGVGCQSGSCACGPLSLSLSLSLSQCMYVVKLRV